MEEGARAARANGRSLIYEARAAPPPVITEYLVRARAAARRPPPPRAQSRFTWREERPPALRLRPRPSRARAERDSLPARRRQPCAARRPGHAPALSRQRDHHAARQARLRPPRLHRYDPHIIMFATCEIMSITTCDTSMFGILLEI